MITQVLIMSSHDDAMLVVTSNRSEQRNAPPVCYDHPGSQRNQPQPACKVGIASITIAFDAAQAS